MRKGKHAKNNGPSLHHPCKARKAGEKPGRPGKAESESGPERPQSMRRGTMQGSVRKAGDPRSGEDPPPVPSVKGDSMSLSGQSAVSKGHQPCSWQQSTQFLCR
jgi:hypothetical protein